MSGSIRVLIVLTALVPGTLSAADLGAQSADQPVLKEVITQLRMLRLELLEQRVESQEGYILQLERDLQQVRADQQSVEQQESEQAAAVAQLEQRLSESPLPEDRYEVEAARAGLIGRGHSGAARSSLDQRRIQVQQQLEQARQQRQKLLEKARRLSLELGEIREAGRNEPRSSRRLARELEVDVKR